MTILKIIFFILVDVWLLIKLIDYFLAGYYTTHWWLR